MKKLKFKTLAVLITSLMLLTLAGCGTSSSNSAAAVSDADSVAADKAVLVDAAIQGTNTNLSNVIGNLTLPSTGDSGSTITWVAAPLGVIANDGVVTRPAFVDGDATITLTATITKGTEFSTVSFTIIVLKNQSDSVSVADDLASLTALSIKGMNADLDNVNGNLTFPVSGSSGTTITWDSDTPGIISNNGTVVRPAFTVGDTTVDVTATITKGVETDSKTFTITVLKNPPTNAEAVAADKASLVANSIRNTNSNLSTVTTQLTLPATGSSGTTITWSSANTNVLSHSGAVTVSIPDVSVTMTATITKGSETATKDFSIIILGTGTEYLSYTAIGDPATAYIVNSGSVGSIDVIIPSYHLGLPVTTTGDFEGCQLTGVFIPNTVTTIGNGPVSGSYGGFAGCASLASVSIPSSVTTISDNAFFSCSGITSIVLPANLTTLGIGAFSACSFASVIIPAGITVIGRDTFNYCTNLSSVTIQGNITSIGIRAFGHTKISTFTIPSTVTTIGYNAFEVCTSLTSVIVNPSTPVVLSNNGSEDIFAGCTALKLITVPDGSETAYRTAINWSTYSSIISSNASNIVDVEEDQGSLVDTTIKGSNADINNVKVNLYLPSSGLNGTTITWSSDNTAVIANNGTVTRPASGASNVSVTLTATITKGASTLTKPFTVTVLELSASSYAITFDVNNGTGTMPNQTIDSGSSAMLNANTFTRASYMFSGWAETSDGGVAYNDKQSYTMGGANVTLYAVWTLSTSLLIKYDFNSQNCNDSSGNSSNGTPNNITYVSDGNGGYSAQFNGTSSFITLPSNTIRSSTTFTVMMRFKTATASNPLLGYQQNNAAATAGNPGTFVPILYINTAGKLIGDLYNGSAHFTVTSPDVVTDNAWHTVYFSAKAGSIALYLDGTQIGIQSSTVNHLNMVYNQIGASYISVDAPFYMPVSKWYYFNGLIDDFYFYNTALH